MGTIVTGIAAPDVGDLEGTLSAAGVSPDGLVVISGEAATLRTEGIAPAGGDILLGTTGTGTGVPGLTSSTRVLGPRPQPLAANEQLRERLGHLEIPDDEIENYVDALAAGRLVVGYLGPDAERAAEVFLECGVARVKVAG